MPSTQIQTTWLYINYLGDLHDKPGGFWTSPHPVKIFVGVYNYFVTNKKMMMMVTLLAG